MTKEHVSGYWEDHKTRIIGEWKAFLSIASISTDSTYEKECLEAAEWLKKHTETLGFKAQVVETKTKPLVVAELTGDPAKPAVLFYGHYDVQPVDPLELWTTPPFIPEIRGERMYARGAQDNKGQLFYFLKAVEFLKSQGVKLPTVKLLIEGEEECGSGALQEIPAKVKDLIKADILMVCDTGALKPGMPTIIAGLRGIISFEISMSGAHNDLHSGVFGGVVVNPAQAMVKLLSTFHNHDGSVAVEGFYSGVPAPTEEEKKLANSLSGVLEQLEQQVGVKFIGGEKAYTTLERRSFRPTLEFNGVGSGYQGAGGKTIIPKDAVAKITTRLAFGQDPERIVEAFKKHVAKHAPDGVKTEVTHAGIGGPAMKLPLESKTISIARKVIKEAFGIDATVMWEGASIPIIPKVQAASGAEPLLVGFGLEEDKIHAPDESFSLSQFQDGMLYVSAFLRGL